MWKIYYHRAIAFGHYLLSVRYFLYFINFIKYKKIFINIKNISIYFI